MGARYIGSVGRIDYDAAPRPVWRTDEGELVDADALRADDIEIDLTGVDAVVGRKQRPVIDHPWAENWPTWPSL